MRKTIQFCKTSCCVIMFTLAGCDGSETSAGREQSVVEPVWEGVSQTAKAITADYLAGAWCYTHFISDGEEKEQKIPYIFKKDGTLLFQSNPMAAVDQPGTWSYRNGRLRINPYFMFFNLKVKSKAPDLLVLDSMGDHFFRRGSCEQQG